jgi:hypothetical protein
MNMEMQDSGQRQQFGTGAQRDTAEDKPRPDLISPFAEQRLGEWLAKGAKKYAERNWEQGMPFSRCTASLNRHLMQWKQGDESEDHLAAIMFNAMAIIHYQEMIVRGVLDADLGDMPDYDPDFGEDNEDPEECQRPPACTCGVDYGAPHRPHCAVMRALDKGWTTGPRVVEAGPPVHNTWEKPAKQEDFEHASEDGWSLDFPDKEVPSVLAGADVPIDPNQPVEWKNYTIEVEPVDGENRTLSDALADVFNQVQFHRELRRIEQEMVQATGLPASMFNLLGCSTATESRLKEQQLQDFLAPLIVPSQAVLEELLTVANKTRVSLDPPVGPFYTSPSGETSTCLEEVEVVTRPLPKYAYAGVCAALAAQGCPEHIQTLIAGGTRFPVTDLDQTPRSYVYIAGPMRGYDRFNFPAFDKARDQWARAGYATISPADIDRASGTDGSDDTPYYPDTDSDRVRADVVRDIHSIFSLDPSKGDKLALLEGWYDSTGALAEYALARWLGIPTVSAESGREISVTIPSTSVWHQM